MESNPNHNEQRKRIAIVLLAMIVIGVVSILVAGLFLQGPTN